MGATISNLGDLRIEPEVIDPPQNVRELGNDPASNAVLELLECPVCFNFMDPPIHQCSNGHTICSGCKPKVHNKCPTCRDELGKIRCFALEKVSTSLELQHVFKINRPYNCPYVDSYSECTVSGDIPHLVAHIRSDHKVNFLSCCAMSHQYVHSNPQEVEKFTWMIKVYSCFGEYFCLHFEAFQLGTAPVYIAFLRFMGDDNDAKKYNYSLEVEGNERKMTWQGVPRSIRDSHRKVRNSFDGLIIQRRMALSFSGEDCKELKLRVNVSIWKK